MPERKTDCKLPTFLGVTNGEWIGLLIILAGFISSYAVLGDNVKDNSAAIKAVQIDDKALRNELSQQIKESEARMQLQVRESEQRTRSDIRELRQIILQGVNGH